MNGYQSINPVRRVKCPECKATLMMNEPTEQDKMQNKHEEPIVRLHYRGTDGEGKGDLVPESGAKSWVIRQSIENPNCSFWYEYETSS